MSEYWKSNAKKYCEYCKVWIADNKASIGIHESGKQHKQNVSKKLDEIKKNSAKKRDDDKKYNDSMAAIERAAIESMKNDLSENPSLRKQYGSSEAIKTKVTPEIEKKVATKNEKRNSSSKSTPKSDDKGIKRKSEFLPEAKIGKWHNAEQKKTVIDLKKPSFVDLQLPTPCVKKPIIKSLLHAQIDVNVDIPMNEPEKQQVKTEEVKNKWQPIGLDDEKSLIKNDDKIIQENFDSSLKLPKAEETSFSSGSNETTLNIKSEKLENQIQTEDKPAKKEKVIAFKKRKIDSIQLRSRTDD